MNATRDPELRMIPPTERQKPDPDHRRALAITLVGIAAGLALAATGAWAIPQGNSLFRGQPVLLLILGPTLALLALIGFGARMADFQRQR